MLTAAVRLPRRQAGGWQDRLVTARRPALAPSEGRFVTLEPMTGAHATELWRALGSPAVFAGGYGGGPAGLPADEAAFAEWSAAYYAGTARQNFVVRVAAGPHRGELVGASTLGDLDEAAGSAHVGWTAYDPRVWGTQVNPETKLLLLSRAFEHGFERVRLQADALNARSRAAIERLGAVFEGVARHDRPRADGSWRDTAIYSILSGEWPAVRRGLEARLAEWGERPVLFRTPPSALPREQRAGA